MPASWLETINSQVLVLLLAQGCVLRSPSGALTHKGFRGCNGGGKISWQALKQRNQEEPARSGTGTQ